MEEKLLRKTSNSKEINSNKETKTILLPDLSESQESVAPLSDEEFEVT